MNNSTKNTYPKNNRTSTSNGAVSRRELEKVLVAFLDSVCTERLMGRGLQNTASLRRVLFFQYFIANSGNATRAAIQAGYSPKSAKQQGYRVLQWLQEEIRKESLA